VGTSKISNRRVEIIIYSIIVLLVIVSCFLAGYGHFQALASWWFLIILFFPVLTWSIKTSYLAPKIFCIVAIFTQVVTVPWFFVLNSDDWVWAGVNPFEFTALETVPIIGKITLFLYAFVIFVSFFHRLSIKKRLSVKHILRNSKQIRASTSNEVFNVWKKGSILVYSFIFILISCLIPLNLWSYSIGLGLTGVEPPRLPYKLTGIIFYFTKYLTPLLLAYLYSRTKRNWFMALIFLSYAWVFGLCSVSKGAILIIMAPVIVFAWIDQRRIVLFFSSVGAIIGVTVASAARVYVHFVQNGVTGADTSLNIFQLIGNVLTDPNIKLLALDYVPLTMIGIAARIEGFGNLVLAQHYDPNAVIGSAGVALRMIWAPLVALPFDAHHLQWSGSILPDGFYSGGAILSNTIIMSNGGLWWIIVSAMITAMILVISEKIVNQFVYSYSAMVRFKGTIIFILTLLYFIESTFSRVSLAILICLTISSWISPFIQNKSNNRVM
jgi:hypothetical protein